MPEQSPRHLILSLCGLYAREDPQWLSVRWLIALMADLSVDPAATRSSVSRLKKRCVLEQAKVDGQAGYRLSASAQAVLREGDARIWSRPRASVGDGWLVVVFSVPEAERGKRHELRSLLTTPLPKSFPDRLSLLDQLAELQQAARRLEAQGPTGVELFGTLWQADATDFTALAEASDWIGRLLAMAVGVNIPTVVGLRQHEPDELRAVGSRVAVGSSSTVTGIVSSGMVRISIDCGL